MLCRAAVAQGYVPIAAGVERRPEVGLGVAFRVGGGLIDRDRDGRADGLRIRFDPGLGRPGPDGAVIAAAAAEIGARLGLETSGLDDSLLGETPSDGGVIALRIEPASSNHIVRIDDGTDDARFRIEVIGTDGPGLLRAAREFASRLDSGEMAARVEVDARREDTADLDRAPHTGKERRFGLEALFSTTGLLTDANGDLVPDGFDGFIVPSGEPGSLAAVDVATRVGLETAGLRFPITLLPDAVTPSRVAGPLILIGDAQPLVADLLARKKLGGGPPPGAGEVVVIPDAFGHHSAVVVRGGDAMGLRAAGRLFLNRIPHLHDARTGAPGLADLVTASRRLIGGISPAGQLCRVPRDLKVLADGLDLRGEPCVLTVAVENAPDAALAPAISSFLRDSAAAAGFAFGPRDVTLVDCAAGSPRAPDVRTDLGLDLEWEVDRVRAALDDRLWKTLKPGQRVDLDVRVSEPAGVRLLLETELRRAITARGAIPGSVRARSAWKQGFHYAIEDFLQACAGRKVDHVELRARESVPMRNGIGSSLEPKTRWLQELYPADAVLAKALGLAVGTDVTLALMPSSAEATWVFVATCADASTVIRTFSPATRTQPFNLVFSDYDDVTLTTGLVHATVDGEVVINELVTTDLEEIWQAYQARVLPVLRRDLLAGTAGRPEPRHAPWFSSITFDVAASEPDEALDVGQERIAPLDSLHEELYFHTLHFTALLGQTLTAKPFEFTGSVVPRVTARAGTGPRFEASVVARRFPGPCLALFPALGAPHRGVIDPVAHRDLRVLDIPEPRVTSLAVAADGRLHAHVRFRADVIADDRAAWIRRQRPEEADTRVLSADFGVAIVGHYGRLRADAGGTLAEEFSFGDVDEITFEFEAEGEVRSAVLDVSHSGAAPAPQAPDLSMAPADLVPDTRPVTPDEAAAILGRLAQGRAAHVARIGTTSGGSALWALETGPFGPGGARHVSRQKLAAWKPTLMISAREHANEVSSTTHVLQSLRTLLAGDGEALRDVRVVVNPVWNADGANLAMELARVRPDDLLHAGYLGRFGENLVVGQESRDPVQREARARLDLFATHLPDVFFNPHGYPMHEWIQPFSGYAAWVKQRDPKTRDWWAPRGFFLQTFQFVDAEDQPELPKIAAALRDRVVKAVRADPAVSALNAEQYDRYRRWGAFDRDTFRLPLVDGVQVNGPIRGVEAKKDAVSFAQRAPKTCIANVIMEVPDETARGDHLRTVCAAGRAVTEALVAFLRERSAMPETKVTLWRDGATRIRARKRDVAP